MHLIRLLIIRSANLADEKRKSKPISGLLFTILFFIDKLHFLQKNVSNFFFVRLSSFFAHNLFTNFQYDKTIKNNNRFLIDFFHTFLSFEAGFMSVSFLSIRLDYSFSIISRTCSTSISNKSLICSASYPFRYILIIVSAIPSCFPMAIPFSVPSTYACSFIP